MKFDELSELLGRAGQLDVGRGASEAAILAAELALGVAIQGDYRLFLERYGWGGVGDIELYGLGDDVPHYLDLTVITISERTEMSPQLRNDLVPIMNDGGGNLYCLDTKSSGPAVVFWDHDEPPTQTPEVAAPDFFGWLASKVTGEP